MTVILSPYSRVLTNGICNAKNYPYWQEVINVLFHKNIEVIQIGGYNEPPFQNVVLSLGLGLKDLTQLAASCTTWASVDNFFPHLCSHIAKPGVVVWSRSDPLIFGYAQNSNLLKDRSYLRPDQFGKWTDCPFLLDAFIDPTTVANAILSRCN